MSTIAAISTGQAAGGIGIVRISGENALSVADRIFKSVSGAELKKLKGYRALFGKVVFNGKYIDEAVALVFRAPKSYTGEDVVEISCHGGLFVTKQVLRAALSSGAAPAEAGEFTKRAFLNGKMDLTEAESVMNIISAKSEQARAAALNTLDGALYKKISDISSGLKRTAAYLAAWVDYPDDEIEDLSDDKLKKALLDADRELTALINRFDVGQAVIEGVETAIIGRPNVGKSTLMNLLTGYDKSIVTSVAGTTRDIVEETVTLGGVVLRLADTAGLHKTTDTVEKIGVSRTERKTEKSALILSVFDASQELNSEDEKIFSLCEGKKAIAVINKTDLKTVINTEIIDKNYKYVVYMSAKNQNGLSELEKAVADALGTEDFDTSAAVLMNERQLACCSAALESIKEAETALKSGITRDAINVNIDVAVEKLDALTGERATESIVNEIFSQFCVGK